jgi:elongation factor Ts
MENDPKMANKPAQVREKIVEGKLNKFYSENCLLQQEFVKDNSLTVEKYLAAAAKSLGSEIKFLDAVRFEKGEGIEKKQENFAAEIASMIKG